MPLIDVAGYGNEPTQCACSATLSERAEFYAHVIDCPIDRCLHCLEWLPNDHEKQHHICPKVKLAQIARYAQ